ncbi:alkaline phosphatase family protein [candidate division KSB1 bacterium]|nr:alkaline phosphatase family protein [candidate division KSB1 bacterium]NIR71792.1 alkaline phosphatase family protein [candidate division KSB1 bacterium]NIS25774.1 alkaline phosphatase family protein [candidate division KSB1 bacterium]NIT72643.1 alkaline phosphatase family protein [candidate division KSB1 bacterium]NIU26464.1 alkaline phosphatase family protein [candidate division KSB1 bacterium]
MTRLNLALSLMIFLSVSWLSYGCKTTPSEKSARPKLAVVVVVDQMRADHLTRFEGVYEHGFARLLNQGATFTTAYHDHAYTVTGAGHASISAGVHPSRHGIVGNHWYDRAESKEVYCAEDTTCPLLGYPEEEADNGRSPVRMLASSLGDWLKEQSPESKVFGIGRKDRAAIFSAGLKADGAYWYNDGDGNMITSKYYMTSYPAWVKKFNESRVVDTYFQEGWHKLKTEQTYFLAREDSFSAENDGKNTAFPYEFTTKSPKAAEQYYGDLQSTPFSDALLMEFAKALVENENLGRDDAPDILFIGCSAADAIGHTFGPLSQESLDHFLRLDAYLGQFFTFLDGKIGNDNYITVLSSDHGVMPLPEELARRGFDAKRVSKGELVVRVGKVLLDLSQELGVSERLISGITGFGVIVNYSAVADKGIRPQELDARLISRLKDLHPIEDVFSREDLTEGKTDGRPYRELYAHSFHPDRCGDLMFRIKEYYLLRSSPYGTTHGSPYPYDTHIPFVVSGPGIAKGQHTQKVRTVDIAPTLANILGIDRPVDLDGQSLFEEIKAK